MTAHPAGNEFIDKDADGFTVAKKQLCFTVAALSAPGHFESEIHQFSDDSRLARGITPPVDAVLLRQALLIAFAEVSVVIKQNFNFKGSVDAESSVSL